jgi:hypothetical protein
VQVAEYQGDVISRRKREKSPETQMIEDALKRCATTGTAQRIYLEDGDDRDKIVYRIRSVAAQLRVSCSLGAPADNEHDIVIVQARPKADSELALAPPPTQRHPATQRRRKSE